MLNGNLFFDSQGYPRAEYSAPYEVVGWYLEQDIQSSDVNCEEILQVCDRIANREEQEWGGVGNAHDINIRADGVRIENVYSDTVAPCELTIEEFKEVIRAWKSLVESHTS